MQRVAGRRADQHLGRHNVAQAFRRTDFADGSWWLNLTLTGAVKTPVYVRPTESGTPTFGGRRIVNSVAHARRV